MVEHDAEESLSSAYGAIDVALLPQELGRSGADVQLPAKLIDAMAHGVPVVATRSNPVYEMAGESAVYVDDWSDTTAVRGAIANAFGEVRRLGPAAHETAKRDASLARIAGPLRKFMNDLVMRRHR